MRQFPNEVSMKKIHNAHAAEITVWGFLVILSLWSEDAKAEDTSIGLGAAIAPEYVGSRDTVIAPVPSFSTTIGPVEINSDLLGINAGFKLDQYITVGPIVRLDLGRNALFKVNDPVVARLPKIKVAPEFGAFIQAQVPIFADRPQALALTARLSAVKGTSAGHGGVLVEGDLGAVKSIGDRTTTGVSVTFSWQDRRYADAYFGVDQAAAAATGLSRFSGKAGIRDLGSSVFIARTLSEHWSASAFASLTELKSSAADSPIVQERGRTRQTFLGLSATYSF